MDLRSDMTWMLEGHSKWANIGGIVGLRAGLAGGIKLSY